MAVDVRIQHGLQPVTQARALQTLLAVNAILPLPIESMLARIDEELQANPALDRETYPCAQCGHPVEGVVCGRCGHSVLSGTARFRGEGRATASRADGEEFDPLSQATRPPSLIEHLEHALAAHLKNPEDLRIGEYLIGCLDSRGYFDGDVNYAAADLDVPVAALERVLKQIQSLDPPGVGARSLQECLLIQLQGLAPSPIRTVATRIIADHLAEVARERHAVVAEALGIAVAEVREALAFMRRNLSPSPAEQFAAEHGGNTLRPEEVALPDVILTRTETGYKIEINGAGALTLRLNPFYRQALARTDRDAPALAPADRENLRNQVRRARLFIETVRRRTWTLYSCVEHIVEVQRAFLDRGPAHLVPLTMSAVAQALTISESTVSRALDAKYVQMPNGRIVSFEIFFDQSTPVKERIKTIIAAEETSRPLTDAEIAKTLATEGFPVARRTVAKYREELRLPAWRHRQRSRAAH